MSFEAFKIGVALEVLNSITTRSINSLNADMLRVISDFLTKKDMRMLTHVNTEVHLEWTGYRYISLNIQYSLLYCFHDDFLYDVSTLGNVHTLDLSSCWNVI